MSFYRHHVYPHLVAWLGNPKPIEEIRRRIIPLAQGDVLEIGIGPGENLALYDPARVNRVYALEPNPGMLSRAGQLRQRTKVNVEFLEAPAERIPLADSSVDTVVSTFTLCTIPGVMEALDGVRRILKPGGKLIFFEHGISPDPAVQKWQKRTEPFFRWAFEGCHVTRDVPSLIAQTGFDIGQMDAGYLSPFPKSGSYCWWGLASPGGAKDLPFEGEQRRG